MKFKFSLFVILSAMSIPAVAEGREQAVLNVYNGLPTNRVEGGTSGSVKGTTSREQASAMVFSGLPTNRVK